MAVSAFSMRRASNVYKYAKQFYVKINGGFVQ